MKPSIISRNLPSVPLLAAAILLTGAGDSARAQGFLGQPVQVTGNYPNTSTVAGAGSGTQTITASGNTFTNLGGLAAFITPNQAVFTNQPKIGFTFSAAPFNGPVVQEVGAAPAFITGATIDPASTVAGLTSSDLFRNGNTLYLNLQGLTFGANDNVTIDFTTGAPPVPEASGAASLGLMLAMGLLLATGTQAARRRARRSQG